MHWLGRTQSLKTTPYTCTYMYYTYAHENVNDGNHTFMFCCISASLPLADFSVSLAF